MGNKAQKGQEFFISKFEKELEDGTIFNDEVLPKVIAAHVELTTTMSKQVNEDSSWESQNSGTEEWLSSVHFVDTQNGWVVGRYGTILHTYNGGKNWERQEIYLQ